MKLRKFVIVDVCMIICLLVVALLNVKQEKTPQPEESESEVVTVPDSDVVKLSEVDAPKFTDVFAELNFEGYSKIILWGEPEDDYGYFCKESGYPGFNKPMLIVVDDILQCDTGKIITVDTSYGSYLYQVDKVGAGVLSDSGNIVDKDTERSVIDWVGSEEELYLFSTSEHKFVHAKLQHGTKIIV